MSVLSMESDGVGVLLAKDSDPILFWNDVALEANRQDHSKVMPEQGGPTLSARALAIVHLAMHDAVALTDATAGLTPYLPGPAVPASPSVEFAVAGAAYTALLDLYSEQQALFDAKLAEAGDAASTSHSFGGQVAQAILADRATDPRASDDDYNDPPNSRGKHRPDPDNPEQGYYGPLYGAQSKGFAITARHELDAPPHRASAAYLDALRQVRGKGIAPELMGTLPASITARIPDETVAGIFWAYDGANLIGTPPRLYNQIVRAVALDHGNSVADNARLFALINVAMADAGILAWDQKYIHNLWRPVLGIREHDQSLGPTTTQSSNDLSDDCDTTWLPLGAPKSNSDSKNFTPNFPAYPSGHATFGAAALHMTRLFYGVEPGDRTFDDLLEGLTFVSDELDGKAKDNRGTVRPRHVREFEGGLWHMIEENGRSRVYLGVHWLYDAFATANGDPDYSQNIGGVPLGCTIAEDIFAHGLTPSPVGPRP